MLAESCVALGSAVFVTAEHLVHGVNGCSGMQLRLMSCFGVHHNRPSIAGSMLSQCLLFMIIGQRDFNAGRKGG